MKFGIREIIFVVLLTAIPVGAWWFIFRPHNERATQMLEEISAKQAKLRELNRATAEIGNLKKEIASLEKALSYFSAKLPSEKEIDKVLKEVWMLAEQNRLLTKSIRTQKRSQDRSFGPADGRHAEQPIQMELEGDYLGLYSFLLALENQPRIMRIRNLDLQTAAKGSPGRVKATLELSIFFDRKT